MVILEMWKPLIIVLLLGLGYFWFFVKPEWDAEYESEIKTFQMLGEKKGGK